MKLRERDMTFKVIPVTHYLIGAQNSPVFKPGDECAKINLANAPVAGNNSEKKPRALARGVFIYPPLGGSKEIK